LFDVALELKTKKSKSMKGIWWNCEGLADLQIICLIHEMAREHKLDFIVLLYTGRANFATPFLKHLLGGLDYMWYCLAPRGRSGVFWLGWKQPQFKEWRQVISMLSFSSKVSRMDLSESLLGCMGQPRMH
jgi:hypothetical protein